MEIFWRLVLGHLIGDFTLQTNYIAAWKRRSLAGMIVHCAIHPVLYALLLWNYMGRIWLEVGPLSLSGWACVFIIFASHFIEDQWRVWSVLKRNAPDNTFFYVWDQVIHYAVLFIIAPSIEGATSKYGFLRYPPIADFLPLDQAQGLSLWDRFMTVSVPEPWVLAAILIVIVTHFTTVSIYFVEKDFFGKDFPGDAEKYIGMAERLAVTLAFLLPGHWSLAAAGVWLAYQIVGKIRKTSAASWTNLGIGYGTAVLCGLLIRKIL